mmetsp:Transcript_39335/g.93033  ORF Transcript_39335/g.93033 Transcript_39335/m.93033 type:complete len:203 (-) Transcript_39335:1703-2311(-)
MEGSLLRCARGSCDHAAGDRAGDRGGGRWDGVEVDGGARLWNDGPSCDDAGGHTSSERGGEDHVLAQHGADGCRSRRQVVSRQRHRWLDQAAGDDVQLVCAHHRDRGWTADGGAAGRAGDALVLGAEQRAGVGRRDDEHHRPHALHHGLAVGRRSLADRRPLHWGDRGAQRRVHCQRLPDHTRAVRHHPGVHRPRRHRRDAD